MYFFFWPLCCLFFFDIRFLNAPLVSSNSSYTSQTIYILRYMERDWTASFSIRFRNGPCIIILDKKYNIANSSCHFGSSFGPYNIFLVTDRSIYCHMTLSAMNYLLYILFFKFSKVSNEPNFFLNLLYIFLFNLIKQK